LNPVHFVIAIVVIFAAVIGVRYYRRKQFDNQPFPDVWNAVLHKNIPIYSNLPDALQMQLQRLVKVFIRDKKFYGCDGLIITDEIRLTIAGEACLLILNRPTNDFYQLYHILVYPSSFIASREERGSDGVVSKKDTGLLGESWSQGKVILSWDDVIKGAKDFSDGHNVVLHEFAHQLDQESGSTNGAPLLGAASSYQQWACVLSEEYQRLQSGALMAKISGGVIDQYGATNPAEFFAVVTETFFERPVQLKNKHPELFEEMKTFYAVDPSDWVL